MSAENRPRIVSHEDAARLVSGVLKTLNALEEVIQVETDMVSVGRLKEGLAQEEQKTELGAAYMQGLEHIKANAVALARFAPDQVAALKEAHRSFTEVLAMNQTVLATARAVSEGLMKTLAEEVSRTERPSTYAAPGASRSLMPRAEPLLVSKHM